MAERKTHAVTGAYGYCGKYIAMRLLREGHRVLTLTNSINRRNPFADRIQAYPFNFDNPKKLTDSLKDVSVLYNTYWVRFNHITFNHASAIENVLVLFDCARKAGVERIVHISVTNASEQSHLEYFNGKGTLEKALMNSGISYSILRPALFFGEEDILINNIAWMLRRLPIFGVFGDGSYRVQPIYIHDFADLAVEQGERRENGIIDAIGPETFTYRSIVEQISEIIGKKRPIVSVPPAFGYAAGIIIGKMVNDIVITRDEIDSIMTDLLYVNSPPAGQTRFTDWAKEHAASLGKHYASHLARTRDRLSEYSALYRF